jgi:hypothetical protein
MFQGNISDMNPIYIYYSELTQIRIKFFQRIEV